MSEDQKKSEGPEPILQIPQQKKIIARGKSKGLAKKKS